MAVAEVAAAAMVVAAAATAGLEVAATAGSLAAEVVAGAAAAEVVAAAGSLALGSAAGARGARVARAAAYPGECAACAESHDLTAGLTEDAVIGLEAPQALLSGDCVRKYRRCLERRTLLPDAGAVRVV